MLEYRIWSEPYVSTNWKDGLICKFGIVKMMEVCGCFSFYVCEIMVNFASKQFFNKFQ